MGHVGQRNIGFEDFFGDGDLYVASISDDGDRVAYRSRALDLVTDQVDDGVGLSFDVFLYDTADDSNTLLSRAFGTTATAGDTVDVGGGFLSGMSPPMISGDGQFVVFASNAIDLLETDIVTDTVDRTYLYDVADDAVILVSRAADGTTDAPALLAELYKADDHGLLPWCLNGSGRNLMPFSALHGQFPEVWADCLAALR